MGDIAFEAVAGECIAVFLYWFYMATRRGLKSVRVIFVLVLLWFTMSFPTIIWLWFFPKSFSIPPEKKWIILSCWYLFSDPFLKIVLLIIFLFPSLINSFENLFCYLTAANESFNFTIMISIPFRPFLTLLIILLPFYLSFCCIYILFSGFLKFLYCISGDSFLWLSAPTS